MKTKKEILQDYLEDAQESLIKIDISYTYLQNRYAQDKNQHILEELAKLEANKKETENWQAYIKEQMEKEK
jgi:hypothetical protein